MADYNTNFLSFNGLSPKTITLLKEISDNSNGEIEEIDMMDEDGFTFIVNGVLQYTTYKSLSYDVVKVLSEQMPDTEIKFSHVDEDTDELWNLIFKNGVVISDSYFDPHEGEDEDYLDRMYEEDEHFDESVYWDELKKKNEALIDLWHK